jgi:uncharacterized protein (TIGR00730 family)
MDDEQKNNQKPIVNVPDKDLDIKPLTLAELHESAKKREARIDEELKEGFEFIESYAKSVTFFGSARLSETDEYYKKAQSLSKRIVEELGYAVITGGGPGIMEAANRGAFESGGDSLGMTIKLPHEQVTNPFLTGHEDFYYFFTRKVIMTFSAEAYVYFPGGFGTLDEFFEIATLVQTNKIEKVPIILIGDKFWNGLERFLKEEMLSINAIEPEDFNLFTITEDEGKIIDIVRASKIRNGIPYHYDK